MAQARQAGPPRTLTAEQSDHLRSTLGRMESSITELAARWHRAAEEGSPHGPRSLHTCGRMEGYVQAISLLLGCDARMVRRALEGGEL